MKKLILSITLCTLLAFSGIAWGNPYNKTNGSSSSDASQFGRDDATSTIKPVINNDNLDIGTGTLTAGEVSTTSITGGDLDMNGNYLTQSQSVADLASRGRSFWFDGVDDGINGVADAKLNFYGSDEMTLVASFKSDLATGTTYHDVFSWWADARNRVYFRYPNGSGATTFGVRTEFNDITTATNVPEIVCDTSHHIIAVSIEDTIVKSYLDGSLVATDTGSSMATCEDVDGYGRVGVAGSYFNGSVSRGLIFNLALSADEVKALSSGGEVPYTLIGASQTELTSGTLTLGKKYRLKDWITADDFTNVGAASNADGVEFIATGTTPTTWTNGSKVVQIGCVLDLNESGITPSQWVDSSPNHLNGTVSGAKVVNEPAPVIRGSQVNLLTNSGFGVWSQSDGLYEPGTETLVEGSVVGDAKTVGDAADLVTNGTAWTGATGATQPTGWAVYVAGEYTITDSGDGSPYDASLKVEVNGASDNSPGCTYAATTVVGKLYKITFSFKHGTATAGYVRVGTAVMGNQLYDSGNLTDADWSSYTGVFEATTTTSYIGIRVVSSTPGQYELFDQVSLHEVTPGITSGTNAGPDGWRQLTAATCNVFREHNGSNTKEGSFYAAKLVSSTQGYLYQLFNTPVELERFLGRTITMGAWVKSATANNARTAIQHDGTGAGVTYSSEYAGTDYTWLEVTHTIPTDATFVSAYGAFNTGAGTAYISQPMLVFSSSLGTGNFCAPPNEIINFVSAVTLTDYNNDAIADAAINLEAQSNGKIPKGVKAVYANVTGTGAAATDKIELYESSSKAIGGVVVNLDGTNPGKGTGRQGCDSDGNIYIDETGTCTATTLKIIGAQVN